MLLPLDHVAQDAYCVIRQRQIHQKVDYHPPLIFLSHYTSPLGVERQIDTFLGTFVLQVREAVDLHVEAEEPLKVRCWMVRPSARRSKMQPSVQNCIRLSKHFT